MCETLSKIQPAQHTQDIARDDEHICRNGDRGKEWPWGKDISIHYNWGSAPLILGEVVKVNRTRAEEKKCHQVQQEYRNEGEHPEADLGLRSDANQALRIS